jgi:S-disulfanyl-L-cysteine oxidoreductase SoxD
MIPTDEDQITLSDTDPDILAAGAVVYQDNCASCHGGRCNGQANWRGCPDGRLPAPPHDKTGHTWHHGSETLFRLTKIRAF